MQPAAFLPGEHEIIMVGPEQVRRRGKVGNVVRRRAHRTNTLPGPASAIQTRRPWPVFTSAVQIDHGRPLRWEKNTVGPSGELLTLAGVSSTRLWPRVKA